MRNKKNCKRKVIQYLLSIGMKNVETLDDFLFKGLRYTDVTITEFQIFFQAGDQIKRSKRKRV